MDYKGIMITVEIQDKQDYPACVEREDKKDQKAAHLCVESAA